VQWLPVGVLLPAAASTAAEPQHAGSDSFHSTQDKEDMAGSGYTKQRLILGTHTSDNEQNYLMVAEVDLPAEDTAYDGRGYDEEKGEVGGFGAPHAKVRILQQINHTGEVNRAR
jgi:histone-binding protein RBBP4